MIHHQTSRSNIQQLRTNQKEFDNIIIAERPPPASVVRPVQSYDNPRYTSYHYNQNQNYNVMTNANSGSNLRIPMSAILDPDTEMSDGGDIPFDRLLVVPIQSRL